jgi:hypothetical protein
MCERRHRELQGRALAEEESAAETVDSLLAIWALLQRV